ncbi:MAG: chromosomal replication initiator protein DnaA [Treponema sp.]|nr:chromosomal replication initiator protein DnaA [Treponema sp.]
MSEHNYEDVWKYALEQIKQQFIKSGKETEFKLWFNMNYVEDTISTITVSVASEFLWQSMLKKGNVQLVSKKIEELTGQTNIKIQHIISNQSVFNPEESDSEIVSMSSNSDESDLDSTKNKLSEKKPGSSLNFTDSAKSAENKKALKKHPQLFEKYTFDTFIPGSNSDYAYNAAIAASKNPGKTYNPILLYGGVGLGKTHLMEAIGNYIYQERGDSFKICYVPAETFTNEFTSSIKAQTTEKFKSKYRNLDVLLLDDIQFLQGKAQTQEELFHTFNALHDSSSQMVFTCDRPVTELKDMTDRLRSRFSNGLIVDLQPPEYETRYAILLKKLETLGKSIPEDVIAYIAKNVVTNVRDLESALTKMIGYSELVNKNLTIEIAQQQLRDTFSQPLSGTITIDTIQKVVSDYYNISITDIKSKKRDKKYVYPRQIAIYLSRELTEYSYPEIGQEFGGRDHTTAMHADEKIRDLLKTDSSLNSLIQMLIRNIKDYKK